MVVVIDRFEVSAAWAFVHGFFFFDRNRVLLSFDAIALFNANHFFSFSARAIIRMMRMGID